MERRMGGERREGQKEGWMGGKKGEEGSKA